MEFKNVILISSFLSLIRSQREDCKAPMDFAIVVDGSDSITASDFQLLRISVGNLTEQLNIAPGQGRMGIVVYSKDIAMEIPLTTSKAELIRNAQTMPHPRDGTNTALGIQTMRRMFEQSNRPNVPRIAAVVTDGISKDPPEAARQANLTKALGVNMYTIGVGEFIDYDELNVIASNSDQVLMVDSFGTLSKDIGKLVKLICPVDCGLPPEIPYATILPGPTSKGSVREYQCDPGTRQVGNPKLVCLKSGMWSKTDFRCRAPPPVVPPSPPRKGPCDGCAMLHGIGYNAHHEECDKFVQCYFDDAGNARAVVRQCPFGQFWDQRILTCRRSDLVACPTDMCKRPGLQSYRYGDRASCRSFWKCHLGRSVGRCCPLGFTYVPFIGCKREPTCVDACPPPLRERETCAYRPVLGIPDTYQEFLQGFGWTNINCPPGSLYNHYLCMCEFHSTNTPGMICKPEIHIPFSNGNCKDKSDHHYKVENHNVAVTREGYGYFNGFNSKLVIQHIDKMRDYRDLVIKIRYRDMPGGEIRGLISNGDGVGSSLMVVKGTQNLHYMAKCGNNKISQFLLPYLPGNWNEMYYIHDGKRLKGQVNGVRAEMWAFGVIQNADTGIKIGAVKGFKNFHGFIDEVSIFLCKPNFYRK